MLVIVSLVEADRAIRAKQLLLAAMASLTISKWKGYSESFLFSILS